jgi:hypothetical protein
MGKVKATCKNKNGVDIVMCCASCIHNAGLSSKTTLKRRCSDAGTEVPNDFLCAEWEMKPHMQNAGSGFGRVKKKEYLEYVLENSGKESLDKIRYTWEKLYGSRFNF